jgi:hypothetical protein
VHLSVLGPVEITAQPSWLRVRLKLQLILYQRLNSTDMVIIWQRAIGVEEWCFSRKCQTRWDGVVLQPLSFHFDKHSMEISVFLLGLNGSLLPFISFFVE